jgi:hypothetical protein
MKPLSRKHSAFLDEFLRTFNGTRSYMRVYPHSSERSARANAAKLLANDSIAEEYAKRLKDMHMGEEEVLKLFADHARGDMGEFLDVSGMGFNLDLQEAKKRGLTKLIKKVKQKTTIFLAKKESDEDREVHELEIELYDAQAAGEKIGRHLKLFTDQVELSGQIESIIKKVNVDPDKV